MHGFFADIIRKIGIASIEERLMQAVEAELAVNIGTPTSYEDGETLPQKVADTVTKLVEKVTR